MEMDLFTQFLDNAGSSNFAGMPIRESMDLDSRMNTSKFICKICSKPTLSCCQDCKNVFYCSPEHQIQDWVTHQYECKSSDDSNTQANRSVARSDDATKRQSGVGRERSTSKETTKDLKEDEAKKSQSLKKETEQPESTQKLSLGEIREKTRKESFQVGSERTMNNKDRNKKLFEVLTFYMKLQHDQASLRARKLFEIAKELFETDEEDIFEFLADGLLLVKCLLAAGNVQLARENLLDLWKIAHEFVSEKKIDFTDENDKVSKLSFVHLKRGLMYFTDLETLSPRKKQEVNEQIQRITNIFSVFASLFHAVGDHKNCEEAYVRYIKLIENNFGPESFETSNCYFLFGVFYLELKYYVKSMACFRKSLYIRQQKFQDEMQECIADCYYNIAIIYKQTQKILKAMKCLNIAFKIRTHLIGEFSLPVAQVLELIAKIISEQEDYRTALSKFQECLAIRRKILNDESHPDIVRVKSLMQDLHQIINSKLHDERVPFGKKDMLLKLQREIEGRKMTQEFKSNPSDINKPKDMPPLSKPSMSNVIDDDEIKLSTKIGNSFRGQDLLEVSKGIENDLASKNETPISKSGLKNPVSNIKPLNLQKVRSSRQSEQDAEGHEIDKSYFDLLNQKIAKDRSLIDQKRPTFGPVNEENSSPVFVRPENKRLTPPPNINVLGPDMTNIIKKVHEPKRSPTRRATADTDLKGSSPAAQVPRRSSDNVSDKRKGKKLNLPEEFIESLTEGQIMLLSDLNSSIKGNLKESFDTLVEKSDFFKSLLASQKEEFLKLNPDVKFHQTT